MLNITPGDAGDDAAADDADRANAKAPADEQSDMPPIDLQHVAALAQLKDDNDMGGGDQEQYIHVDIGSPMITAPMANVDNQE
jgi:hypothetical protein